MASENEAHAPEGLKENPEAKSFLSEFVKQEILLVLVHIPTRQSTSSHQPLKQARAWAEHAVTAFNNAREQQGEKAAPASDFLVVEVRKSGTVRTTVLEKYEEPTEDTGNDAEAE